MVRLYLPVPALDNAAFKDMINKLPANIMKRIPLFLEKNPLVCNPKTSTTEFSHNKFIQWRFFKSTIDEHSSPVYKWSRDGQLHVSKYDDGFSKIVAMEININSATTNDQIETVFHIIEFSYWTNYTAQEVCKWISHNYETLSHLGLRVLRLPYINNTSVALPSVPQELSLLYVGMNISALRSDGTLKDRYYIWNGLNVDVYKSIQTIKTNYLSAQSLKAIMGDILDDYLSNVNSLLDRFDNHLKDSNSSATSVSAANHEPIILESDTNKVASQLISVFGEEGAKVILRGLMDRLMKL
jgi:hypothetical protein